METDSWEIKEEGGAKQDREGTCQLEVGYGKREGTNIHRAHSMTLYVVLAYNFVWLSISGSYTSKSSIFLSMFFELPCMPVLH